METYTIATLKEANRQRPILCPDTPNLYFCAVIEMDFDGPDFMGPPILDCVPASARRFISPTITRRSFWKSSSTW